MPYCYLKKQRQHFVSVSMKKRTPLFILVFIVVCAFSPTEKPHFEIPAGWPKPQYDFSSNPFSSTKTQLGRALFYDPVLSRDSAISCNSCHSQYTAFAHTDHALSHGIENRIGTRNAPALMNLAWQNNFMWDGAINHLDMQPLAPISNRDEMDSKMGDVVFRLQRSKIYPALFFDAFADSTITGEHALKAISQYMLTLISANAKYDSVMRGVKLFSAQEENGYRLFKQNCSSCHTEPLFTNNQFENNGLPSDTTLNDHGRMKITKDNSDSLKFKVPTLRNIEFSNPYMHDGRFKNLTEVMNHYTDGIQRNKTISAKLQIPIVLSSNEKVDLTTFLLTLTDRDFLFDSAHSYPKKIFFPGK